MNIIDISQPLVCGQDIDCTIPAELPVYEGFACEEYRFNYRSHFGCYYETAAHLFRGGQMTCDVPVEQFFLPAVVARLDANHAGPIESSEITDVLNGDVGAGDAVIVDTQGRTDRFFSRACGRWMVERRISLLASTLPKYDTGFVNPTGIFTELFRADIPIIANIKNMDRVTRPRVFLIVLPMPVERVCTVPCRAVVIEGDLADVSTLATLLRGKSV